MIIKPFEVKEYILFKKTREALFYKQTEKQLDRVNWEIDRLYFIAMHLKKTGKNTKELCDNIAENLDYLHEVREDIIYFRLHSKMRPKKSTLYKKFRYA